MRLLSTHSRKLKEFNAEIPKYAILSHRWEDEEVTFDALKAGEDAKNLKGYRKLRGAARKAKDHGYDWIWVDTCCIDKSSSAELSEAINSMFQWYKDADMCYAYLSDVGVDGDDYASSQPSQQSDSNVRPNGRLKASMWFTRGWTLQELIAPLQVKFYDRHWQRLGTKTTLGDQIAEVTNIPVDVLQGGRKLSDVSAAAKMSWASRRITTRPEDMAYCLLGLFDVNMPLLYGEGEEKAFMRLQAEFLRYSDDETIYAWKLDSAPPLEQPYCGMLATSPQLFRHSGKFVKPQFKSRVESHATEVTNRGLHLEVSLVPFPGDKSGSVFLAVLQCVRDTHDMFGCCVAILLQRLSGLEKQYARIAPNFLFDMWFRTFQLPSAILAQAYLGDYEKDGGKIEDGGNVRLRTRDVQPEGELIFVRPVPRPSETLSGIYVYEHTQITALPWLTKGRGSIDITVHEEGSSWQTWGESTLAQNPYWWLSFQDLYETRRLQATELHVSQLRKRVMMGCLRVQLTCTLHDSHEFWTRSTYMVVGMEPLPPNPFSTPPGYTRPWYAFASGVDAETVIKRFSGSGGNRDSPETCTVLELPNVAVLEARFTFGSRFSSVCYKVDFSIRHSRV
ncbi:heterokaryon incompatibility protein-domain-containing protein [Schizothecium vesticola]|uniref:Heterokaryon incompatibility protein-domain-containing protein n=1 Tax=Schizothecium vesticola TaxID=314040 RepID=A0AA40F588_9PEZI|nr:heterokaryon incompatibility protein-domain-containing protein [Schizothecium vesticola]